MIQCTLFVIKLLKFKQRVCKMCTFKTEPFKLYKLTNGPDVNVELTKVDAIKMYTQMQSVRRLETIIGNFYQAKKVRGFCHLCNGQEACAVGIYQAMRPEDKIISSYRVHGLCYLMANNAHVIFSELLAKKTGISRGRGGSMHLYAEHFYGGHGIVGAQVPLGAGVALAIKYLDTKGVCFTLYGDGAANQGQVFEAFNMAKLLKLPCVFVCENNKYGMGTSAERSSANLDYYTRGDYIPGIRVDAMDVLAVKQASKFAIDYCLDKEGGPILLELQTYRYFGHSMSDPGTSYRTREEVQQIRQTRDPIKIFSTKIIEKGLVTEEEISKIDSNIKQAMGADAKKAEKDQFPPLEDLTADIYQKGYEQSVRGITNFTNWKHFNVPNTKH